MRLHYIVRFTDLSEDKQEEIIQALIKEIMDDPDLWGLLDTPNPADEDEARSECRKVATRKAERTWYEWEIEL